MTRFIDAPRSRARSFLSVMAAAGLAITVTLAGACWRDAPDNSWQAEVAVAELTSRFGPMADETRDAALERLDVQMSYLLERIEEMRETLQTRERAGEDYLNHLYEQAQLLNAMYMERLETYETLRLEAETERRLGGS